jgi:hypothetical protein
MWSHSLSVSITKPKSSYQVSPLPWAFCFSLSSFPCPSTWSSPWSHHQHDLHHLLHHLECATYLIISRVNRLAHRVSSIHQNQTRTFNLFLFGNWWQPFHKDMYWNLIWIYVACPRFFAMCKGYGQVSWTPNGSISSPYICAKSLDWGLHICIDRKGGRVMSTKWCYGIRDGPLKHYTNRSTPNIISLAPLLS